MSQILRAYTDSPLQLDMGPFRWIQSNPMHKLTDPIQSNPSYPPMSTIYLLYMWSLFIILN